MRKKEVGSAAGKEIHKEAIKTSPVDTASKHQSFPPFVRVALSPPLLSLSLTGYARVQWKAMTAAVQTIITVQMILAVINVKCD